MRLSIILPCFNEVDNVAKLQEEFLPVLSKLLETHTVDTLVIDSIEVIFVDDGSSDDSWLALNGAFGKLSVPGVSFNFARHPYNLGLGAALRTGFAMVTGEIIVTTDCDGTYAFATIPDILALMDERTDIVTASPYHPSGGVDGVPAYRLILSQGSSFIYRVLVDRHIHTYTALFRAYRSEVIKNITFSSNNYLAGTELMVKGMLSGFSVAEYPTILHQRRFGASKAKTINTIKEHLAFQSWILLYRLHLTQFNRDALSISGD